jgi:hypothetical protein
VIHGVSRPSQWRTGRRRSPRRRGGRCATPIPGGRLGPASWLPLRRERDKHPSAQRMADGRQVRPSELGGSVALRWSARRGRESAASRRAARVRRRVRWGWLRDRSLSEQEGGACLPHDATGALTGRALAHGPSPCRAARHDRSHTTERSGLRARSRAEERGDWARSATARTLRAAHCPKGRPLCPRRSCVPTQRALSSTSLVSATGRFASWWVVAHDAASRRRLRTRSMHRAAWGSQSRRGPASLRILPEGDCARVSNSGPRVTSHCGGRLEVSAAGRSRSSWVCAIRSQRWWR